MHDNTNQLNISKISAVCKREGCVCVRARARAGLSEPKI